MPTTPRLEDRREGDLPPCCSRSQLLSFGNILIRRGNSRNTEFGANPLDLPVAVV